MVAYVTVLIEKGEKNVAVVILDYIIFTVVKAFEFCANVTVLDV